VQVPQGAEPGATMSASTPEGRQFSITIPAGFAAGSVMSVTVLTGPVLVHSWYKYTVYLRIIKCNN